jgi:hypothetical protein
MIVENVVAPVATVNVLVVAPETPLASVTVSLTVYEPVARAVSVLVEAPVVMVDASTEPPGALSIDHAKVRGVTPVLDPLSEINARGLPFAARLKARVVGLVTEMLGTGGFSATVKAWVVV